MVFLLWQGKSKLAVLFSCCRSLFSWAQVFTLDVLSGTALYIYLGLDAGTLRTSKQEPCWGCVFGTTWMGKEPSGHFSITRMSRQATVGPCNACKKLTHTTQNTVAISNPTFLCTIDWSWQVLVNSLQKASPDLRFWWQCAYTSVFACILSVSWLSWIIWIHIRCLLFHFTHFI